MRDADRELPVRRLRRWSLTAGLVMAVNTLVVLAILGWVLWQIGRLIGAWA